METATEPKETETAPVIEKNAIRNINVGRIIIGFTEIGNLEIDDFDVNMAISKTITNLGVVEKAYIKSTQSLMKKYIKKDESGNLASANGFYIFNDDSQKEEYQKQIDELNDSVVTEKVWKIKASDLKKIKGIKGTTMAKCFELIIDDLGN